MNTVLFAVFAVLAVLCIAEAFRRLMRRSDELRRKDEDA
jgi:membrane protein implicated in regulation of membrane protease activity